MKYAVTGGINFVLMPKCASTWLEHHFTAGHFALEPVGKRFAVILRDPLERWATGCVEFLKTQHARDNNFTEQMVFDVFFNDQSYLDPHTEPQTSFLSEIDPEQTTWFWMDENLQQNMQAFFHENNINIKLADPIYVSKTDKSKTDLLSRYQGALTDRNICDQLREFYQEDYNLINRVTFYKG